MIGVPHIILLGLIEAVIALLVGVVLLGIKVRKISRSVPKPAESEAEDTAGEVEVLKEKIRGLESELEEARAVEGPPSDVDVTAALPEPALELLKDKNRILSDSISAFGAGIDKNSDQEDKLEELVRAGQELTAALESIIATPEDSSEPDATEETGETKETTTTSEAEKSVSAQETPQDSEQAVEEEDATLQDVVLMNSLQVKILREQQVELASVRESLEQGPGAKDTADELVRLKGIDQKISEIIKAFEKENFALKQLVENWDMSAGQAERDEELAASRVRITELQEELTKTKEEIKSLEHEYDVLFKKTNG